MQPPLRMWPLYLAKRVVAYDRFHCNSKYESKHDPSRKRDMYENTKGRKVLLENTVQCWITEQPSFIHVVRMGLYVSEISDTYNVILITTLFLFFRLTWSNMSQKGRSTTVLIVTTNPLIKVKVLVTDKILQERSVIYLKPFPANPPVTI